MGEFFDKPVFGDHGASQFLAHTKARRRKEGKSMGVTVNVEILRAFVSSCEKIQPHFTMPIGKFWPRT